MTIDCFKHLSIPEQDRVVIKDGIHLLNYDQQSVVCDIYRLYEFYVKLRYDSSKVDQLKIYSFTNLEDFYLYEHHVFALLGEI